MNNLFTYLVDMPVSVKGLVQENADGDYCIFLNARYSQNQVRETYSHEVAHLLRGHHFVEGKSITQIEMEAEDNASLLGAIKQAEQNGLPLASAILEPPPLPLPEFEQLDLVYVTLPGGRRVIPLETNEDASPEALRIAFEQRLDELAFELAYRNAHLDDTDIEGAGSF